MDREREIETAIYGGKGGHREREIERDSKIWREVWRERERERERAIYGGK